MNASLDQALEERLCRYVKIDTQSDEHSDTTPSTSKQYDLLNLLADELRALGAEDVRVTDYANVLATIPGTAENAPTISFMAHVDTALELSGANVKPLVHRDFDGEPIALPDDPSQILDARAFPYLAGKLGEDIITASGTTLLGADDKSGIAIIMTLAEQLMQRPASERGPVRICFTCDEEIGRGVHPDLPQDLAVDFAYTLDGSEAGSIQFETWSADLAEIDIEGVSIHPGDSYGKAVNALTLMGRFIARLPQDQTPATTRDREGFLHAFRAEGNQARATIGVLIRDFELDGLAEKASLLERLCAELRTEEPRARITLKITEQYRNMRYWLEQDMTPVELAREAIQGVGLKPLSVAMRGGTDGSQLTALGVPTPNIFTGQQNVHGPLEWISVQDMRRATLTCLTLIELAAR